jgi:hypothetical protein
MPYNYIFKIVTIFASFVGWKLNKWNNKKDGQSPDHGKNKG